MFRPHLFLRRPKLRRTFRRRHRDRSRSFDVPDLDGHARNMHEVTAARETNEEVPILEQVEVAIETAEGEELFAANEKSRKGAVVIREEEIAVEVGAEETESRVGDRIDAVRGALWR